jgi:hypothetical protein
VPEEQGATKEEDSAQEDSVQGVTLEPAPQGREILTAAHSEMIRPVAEAARGRSPTMTMTTTEHSSPLHYLNKQNRGVSLGG